MKPRFGAPPGAPPARGGPPHAGGSRSGRMTASPRGTRGWPGSRRRCGPVSVGGRPGGPRSPHAGRDGPGGGGAPSRANPHPANDSARAADPGRRTPAGRPPAALAQIPTTYPALGPRHRGKEDWRTLIHASDLTAATAPRNRGLLPAAAARRRGLPRGPAAPPMAARVVGALAMGPAVHPRVHRGRPPPDHEPEAPKRWVPPPRSLSPEDVAGLPSTEPDPTGFDIEPPPV